MRGIVDTVGIHVCSLKVWPYKRGGLSRGWPHIIGGPLYTNSTSLRSEDHPRISLT